MMWLAFLLLACDGTDDETGSIDSGTTDSAAEASSGEALYGQNCANCHGADGSGVSAPSLADRATGWTAEQVADVAENGSGYMSGQDVTSEEALSIGTYVVDELLAR